MFVEIKLGLFQNQFNVNVIHGRFLSLRFFVKALELQMQTTTSVDFNILKFLPIKMKSEAYVPKETSI